MNKQPEITAATRNNLLIAFWKLYETKDVKEIRIKELTDLAGYHRATFYQYFTDIFDLLHQEEDDLIKQIESKREANRSSGSHPDMLEQMVKFYQENGKRLSSLIGSGGNTRFIEKLKKAIYKDFLFDERLPNTPAISVVFEFEINGLLMAFNRWYHLRDELDAKTFIEIAQSIISKGIPATLESLNTISSPTSLH